LPSYAQQRSQPAAAAANTSQGGGMRPAANAATVTVAAAVPTMQPLAPGIARMATNNMGAPVSGPLGGATYMPMPQPAAAPAAVGGSKGHTAAAAGPNKVYTAAVGSFSSAPAPALYQGTGIDSLQQHFAGPKPPQYAPLPATLHVTPTKGSRAKPSSIGPSIDDVSAAAGAPVAQLTWALPKKTHVAFAPAADLVAKAAPVSPFSMPSSMVEEVDEPGDQVSRGAVSHTLTPTWAPSNT
jgi:hypothetical protein